MQKLMEFSVTLYLVLTLTCRKLFIARAIGAGMANLGKYQQT